MATIELADLEIFVAVVRAGSFTRAAKALRTQKAHVSRVIGRLEQNLGVRLLARTTRSLAPTELGRELLQRTDAILAALEETRATLQRSQREPEGVLRLTCGVEFGLLVVNRWICELVRRHPRIRVDVELDNRVVDLVKEGFDLGIRIGQLATPGLVARKLGAVTYALYASPQYLRGRSEPGGPAELSSHDLIMFVPAPPPRWRLVKGEERFDVVGPPLMAVNNNLAARDAASCGLGIALLPRFQAAAAVREGRLVEVLSGWARAPVPVHAVFASRRFMPSKVRAFIDIARSHTNEW